MKKTRAECDELLRRRVYADYYLPLTKRIRGYTTFPVSVQAALLSGAYNLGVGAIVNSTAARLGLSQGQLSRGRVRGPDGVQQGRGSESSPGLVQAAARWAMPPPHRRS
jgi:hypothetical protein